VSRALQRVSRWWLERNGFRSRIVHTSVGDVHALEARGDGTLPPVAVMHGLSSASSQFAAVLRGLKRSCRRVMAVDAPAHGFSPVPRTGPSYETLRNGWFEGLDRLIPVGDPAFVLGNSMGGFAALRYAATRPERVRGLILVSPGGAKMTAERFEELLDSFRLRSVDDALAFLGRLFSRPHPLRRWIAPFVLRELSKEELRILMDRMCVLELLAPDEIESIRHPVLFIWGDQDRILPRESRDFFLKHLPPHAQVVLPPHFGHSPQLEHPQELVELTTQFLSAAELRAPSTEPTPSVA
jgi:pimeloyl-ACP methyl ester carboxylesterase